MLNTKDYSETRKQLQELIDKWGKSNVIKELNTNHKQVQSIIDNKKQFLTKKIIDRINNLYLQTLNNKGDYKLTPLNTSKPVIDIYHLKNSKEYNQKLMRLYKKVDRLWSVIFLLCLLLIICSGLIIHLAR